MAIGGRRPPMGAVVALAAAVVTLLVVNGLVVGDVVRSRRGPEFVKGGEFGVDALFATSTTAPVGPTTSTTSPVRPALTTTSSTTTVPPSQTSTIPAPAEPTAEPAPAPPLCVRPPPAAATRTRSSARRAPPSSAAWMFEPQLTVVVHGAAGLTPDQVVLDYTFSPHHEEREIATYRSDGVLLVNEGGSITFGLVTEASEVSLTHPWGQVPAPLVPGDGPIGIEHGPLPGWLDRPGRRLGDPGGRRRDTGRGRVTGGDLRGEVLPAGAAPATR